MLFNIMSVNKIEIRNLYKIFGEKPLPLIEKINNGMGKDELLEKHNHVLGLSDINLDIPNQSLQVIMGLSGSGKSTLIRHINRLIEPTSGSMMVDGQDVLTLSQNDLLEFRKNKTAMVFQKFALLPHKTVLENVAFGLYIKKIDTAEAEKKSMYWIERVGLLGFEHRYPQQLSGGMQQRVGLARALANDPDILLMDEAFSALDPLIRKDMQDILLELQSELKKTVVFITHDLDEALKLGDRIAILKDGLMDQEGDAVDILLSPKTTYVKNFVEDVNRSRVLKARNIMQDASAISKDLLNGQTLKVKANDVIEKFIDRVVVDKPDLIEVLGENGSAVGYLSPNRLSEILRK
jgi:glycine betaine/proline transport system ATP-binding protein|tara:strand:+ start:116 stop:1165 length:1050 start_codon:yes stop_codon:yes gene_type:complete